MHLKSLEISGIDEYLMAKTHHCWRGRIAQWIAFLLLAQRPRFDSWRSQIFSKKNFTLPRFINNALHRESGQRKKLNTWLNPSSASNWQASTTKRLTTVPLRVQRGDVVLGDGQHAASALGREGGEVAAFAECLKKKMKRLRFGTKEQKNIHFFLPWDGKIVVRRKLDIYWKWRDGSC